MTLSQLNHLEADLEKRGYKKWTNYLIGKEDYAWFKSFGVHTDKNGDSDNDYQIAFRVWNCENHYAGHDFYPNAKIWITVTMLPSNLNDRIDVDYSLQLDIPDISMCERMFEEMFGVVKKYNLIL